MAGSYRHITDGENKFLGVDLLDHLGDALEALEECHALINILSGGNKEKIFEAYQEYSRLNHPGFNPKKTSAEYWSEK